MERAVVKEVSPLGIGTARIAPLVSQLASVGTALPSAQALPPQMLLPVAVEMVSVSTAPLLTVRVNAKRTGQSSHGLGAVTYAIPTTMAPPVLSADATVPSRIHAVAEVIAVKAWPVTVAAPAT